jgi:hypothetical protein
MGKNTPEFVPKIPNYFCCKICDYISSSNKDYNKHLLTLKHKRLTNVTENTYQNIPKNECICGKKYLHRQSLNNHKKTCNYVLNSDIRLKKQVVDENKNYEPITKELVMQLIEQNQNLQEMLHEQHNKMFEIAKENMNIRHIGSNITTNNNTINNTTNNNNFNLNIFLNETCKDAINMSDFIDSLNVKLKDLEYTAKTSYVEGISKIFINGLTSLNVPDRPIHCSDSKRDIIYIKDQDLWEKDDENKTKLTKAIKIVGHKNMKQIVEWQKANPEYNNPDSKQNDRYQEMLFNAMSGSTKEESDKNYEKIIKNIAKEVVIDKQAYK